MSCIMERKCLLASRINFNENVSFVTHSLMSSRGSPEIGAKAILYDSTKGWWSLCVAILTLWPNSCNLSASAINGCTSPRVPTKVIVILFGGIDSGEKT